MSVATKDFGTRLNLGCGPVQPSGWVNVDGSHRAKFAARTPWLDGALQKAGVLSRTEFGPHVRVMNLLEPLPYADRTVSGIYAGELWEHFELADARRLTAECFRVLKPGCALRVTVPDAETFWGEYLETYRAEFAKPRAERNAKVLEDRMHLFFADIASRPRDIFSLGHKHKWMYDEIQLVALFEAAGFRDVERMPFRVSRIPGIEDVQRSNMLTVEGVRPLES
jgi:predicted SAM-dependent methyltransferase